MAEEAKQIRLSRENVALSAKNLLEEAAWQLMVLQLHEEAERIEAVMATVDSMIDHAKSSKQDVADRPERR